jgi:hypothetical protein
VLAGCKGDGSMHGFGLWPLTSMNFRGELLPPLRSVCAHLQPCNPKAQRSAREALAAKSFTCYLAAPSRRPRASSTPFSRSASALS